MNNFSILDLVIGMVFIYFLLSIVCSSAVELWFTLMGTRAKLLTTWLKQIFDKPALDSEGRPLLDSKGQPVNVGQAIMDHCMVTALSDPGKSTSYITASNFFSALMDKITLTPVTTPGTVQPPPNGLNNYITAIQNSTLISGELKRTILLLANEAQQAAGVLNAITGNAHLSSDITTTVKSEMDHFREKVENWYDTNADRLTGKLKRSKALPATLILATIITVGTNADSLSIGKYLYNNKEVAANFADRAIASLDSSKVRLDRVNSQLDTAKKTDTEAIARINSAVTTVKADVAYLKSVVPPGLPFGWKKWEEEKETLDTHIIGWLVTILAMCIGAPFWFDLLNKLANIRGAGPKPVAKKDAEDKK